MELNASGMVLIVAAYAIAFRANLVESTPLRGWSAGLLIVALLAINGGAIFGAWRCVLRRQHRHET